MSGRLQVLINLRSQTAGLRGVQRYTAEVFGRLADRVATVPAVARAEWELVPTSV